MFIEELLGLNKKENFPSYWDLDNIILRIKERFEIYDLGEVYINDFVTDELNSKINADMSNADFILKETFKKLIFSAYYKLNSIGNENEWMDLKWYAYEVLRGYCPCTCRFFYDLEFNK